MRQNYIFRNVPFYHLVTGQVCNLPFRTMYRLVHIAIPFFYNALLCNLPYCNVLIYNVLFCHLPLCNVPLCSVRFGNAPFSNVSFCNIPLCTPTEEKLQLL
jgi:hypothetical protein